MREELPNHISHEQLARFFAGEASPDETDRILRWSEQSADNAELLLQLRIVWADTGKVGSPSNRTKKIDVDKAWENVRPGREQKSLRNYSWTWKVAAGITALIAFTLVLWYYLLKADEITYQAMSTGERLELPDGSMVTFKEESELIYPKAYQGSTRSVTLEGEAFFEVTHNPDRAFMVHAGPTLIEVLGTSFNVKALADSTIVSVESGTVRFSSENDELILQAGNQGIYVEHSGKLLQTATNPIGTDQFWRTKTLQFSGNNLTEVMAAVEKAYGVSIKSDVDDQSNCSLSVTFRNEPLDTVLDVIALTLGLEVSKTNETFTLSGKGCTSN